MKKLIAVSVISISIASGAAVFALNQPTPNVEIPVQTLREAVQEVAPAKEVEEVVEPTVTPTQTVQELVVETVITNEALIQQYGWQNPPHLDSINYFTKNYPQYFQEDNRERSFAYIYNLGKSHSPDDPKFGMTYMYVFSINYGVSEMHWNNLGKFFNVTY